MTPRPEFSCEFRRDSTYANSRVAIKTSVVSSIFDLDTLNSQGNCGGPEQMFVVSFKEICGMVHAQITVIPDDDDDGHLGFFTVSQCTQDLCVIYHCRVQ